MKRIVISIVGLLAIAGALVFFFWDSIVEARVERASRLFFTDNKGIDEVRIQLIMGDNLAEPIGEFLIVPYGKTEKVYQELILTGQELESFLELWGSQTVAHKKQAMCHYAAYGFTFRSSGRTVKETSMCWFCSNYFFDSFDGTYWGGFNADLHQGQKLLRFCDERMPYDRSLEKKIEKMKEEARSRNRQAEQKPMKGEQSVPPKSDRAGG